MDMQHNVVGWFEIPVTDMERAITFYQTVFGFTLERHQMGPLDMAWFPMLDGKMGSPGSLVKYETAYEIEKYADQMSAFHHIYLNHANKYVFHSMECCLFLKECI